MAQNFPRPPVKKALIVAIRYTCFKNVLDDLPLFTPHKDAISFRNLLIGAYLVIVVIGNSG